MISKLLKGAVCVVTLLSLWTTTPEAQAQNRGGRGGSGWGVNVGPGGVYYGSGSGRYYDNRGGYGYGRGYGYGNSYGYGSSYYGRPYYGSNWYGNGYYAPRSSYYYSSPGTYTTTDSYYPSTTYSQAPTYQTPSYQPAPAATASTAMVRVRVPDANAEVFFNGAATRQRGSDRVFETPPLSNNSTNSYEIRARWTDRNGQSMDQARTVEVQPGREHVVDFTRQ